MTLDTFTYVDTTNFKTTKVAVPFNAERNSALKALKQSGLSIPRDTEIFWHNSRDCEVSVKGKIIGRLYKDEVTT